MSNGDDRELMAAIQAAADRAVEARPKLMDILALATELGGRFEHRSVDEIRERIRDVFRARNLHWAD